jgi:HlyD family secretion protein
MASNSRSKIIRRIAYVLVGLVIVGFVVSRFVGQSKGPDYVTVKAQQGDVQQTVELTGTTEPKTRYTLQFTKSGVISQIFPQVGSFVKSGDVLAILQNGDVQDQLAAQKDALKIAQANLAKALAPQLSQNIQTGKLREDSAQLALDNANTASQNFSDSSQSAINSAQIALQTAQTNLSQAQENYNYAYQNIQTSTWSHPSYPVYDSGYYYGDLRSQMPQAASSSTSSSSASSSTAALAAALEASSNPTPGYTTDVNTIDTAQYAVQKAQQAYDQAQQAYDKVVADAKSQSDTLANGISQAQVSLQTAQQGYDLTVAKPRSVDVAPLQAMVDQATDAVSLAQYQLDQTMLKAPDDGVVSAVNGDPGDMASPGQPFITLDSKFLYIKALVSEADIAKVQLGQAVDLTFDAFGDDTHFKGAIAEVDPSETIVQGVVYYVVKVQFDSAGSNVKPGMTANLTIQTNTKSNVLEVPARAVQYDGGQAYVQVLAADASGQQTAQRQNVTIGLQGDDNFEVLSGLQAGQDVVTFTKS